MANINQSSLLGLILTCVILWVLFNNVSLIGVVLIVVILWLLLNDDGPENFNESTGTLCRSCQGKTFNQCVNCFNCGFCVDKFGNSSCIAGDVNGPYNYEDCRLYYTGDKYTMMMQQNKPDTMCT